MSDQTFIFRILITACAVVAVVAILYEVVIRPAMRRMKYNQRIPIVEVFGAIEIIVGNECAIYERYFANTTDVSFVAMTNSQFINVYNDLSSRILHALSPGFLEMANVYLTTDEIYAYTSRMVYNWLADKVQTVPDTGRDMDDEEMDDLEEEESFLV